MGKPLIPIPAATASSRARVTGRPRLLEPSPDTSMTRRLARNGDWKQRCRVIDGAADRGAATEQLARRTLDRSGKRGGGFLLADARPPHHLNLQRRPRPLHHGHGNGTVRSGANGLQHARVAKRGDIAALLQLEADLIDAARCIDCKHELQVDCGLRDSRRGGGKHHEQCQADGAAGCGPLSSARPGEGHPATLASRGPRCGDPDLGPTFPLSRE
jgi:hypothetical protein